MRPARPHGRTGDAEYEGWTIADGPSPRCAGRVSSGTARIAVAARVGAWRSGEPVAQRDSCGRTGNPRTGTTIRYTSPRAAGMRGWGVPCGCIDTQIDTQRPCRVSRQGLRPGRGGRIRTDDLFVPNEARYQAALHPVVRRAIVTHAPPRATPGITAV